MAGVYRNTKGRWAGRAQAWARSRRRRGRWGMRGARRLARGARTGRHWTCRGVRSAGRAGRRWAQAAGARAHGERNCRARGARRQLSGRRARGRA